MKQCLIIKFFLLIPSISHSVQPSYTIEKAIISSIKQHPPPSSRGRGMLMGLELLP